MNDAQDVLPCSTRTTQRYEMAQAEYLKLRHSERSLVREGVFGVKVTLEGADGVPMSARWT